jgi:hypothetical protein
MEHDFDLVLSCLSALKFFGGRRQIMSRVRIDMLHGVKKEMLKYIEFL